MHITKYFKKNWLNLIIIIVFVILAIWMAQFHELWSDEAQSWLLARDMSFSEMFIHMRNEGTPPLWVYIIKLFMLFGITYDYFFIIPIIFMSIGLCFLYTKFEMPWYLKILFPFTYFVFYQTTIVVRSYSLVLLGISMMYYYFPKRYQSPWKFFFSILFFMGISLHTYLVAGGFYAISLYFLKKDYKTLDEQSKKKIKTVYALIFLAFLLILVIIIPGPKIGFSGNGGQNIFLVVGESTFADDNIIVQVLSTIAIVGIIIYILYKKYKITHSKNELNTEIIKLLVVVPLLLLYTRIHSCIRYFALLYFMIVLYLIKNKEYPIVKVTLVIMFLVQIIWNIQCCTIDYKEKIAVGKEIAEFLEEVDYKNKTIDTLNYHAIEISPYFEGNIFEHSYHTDNAFYSWSVDNGYSTVDDLVNSNADIYIISVNRITEYTYFSGTSELPNKAVAFFKNIDKDEYNVYSFKSELPMKNHIDEYDTFFILVNEKVQQEMDEKNIHLEIEDRTFYNYFDGELIDTLDFSKFKSNFQ